MLKTIMSITKERNEYGSFIFIKQSLADHNLDYPVRFLSHVCGEIGFAVDDLEYIISELQRHLPSVNHQHEEDRG